MQCKSITIVIFSALAYCIIGLLRCSLDLEKLIKLQQYHSDILFFMFLQNKKTALEQHSLNCLDFQKKREYILFFLLQLCTALYFGLEV